MLICFLVFYGLLIIPFWDLSNYNLGEEYTIEFVALMISISTIQTVIIICVLIPVNMYIFTLIVPKHIIFRSIVTSFLIGLALSVGIVMNLNVIFHILSDPYDGNFSIFVNFMMRVQCDLMIQKPWYRKIEFIRFMDIMVKLNVCQSIIIAVNVNFLSLYYRAGKIENDLILLDKSIMHFVLPTKSYEELKRIRNKLKNSNFVAYKFN
jgi:predicted signal transduction protein with EAL and GGDEF domain